MLYKLLTALVSAVLINRATCSNGMPDPWYRELNIQTPFLNGSDIFLLQNLLQRAVTVNITSLYDAQTALAVTKFQSSIGLTPTGIFDSNTADLVLDNLSADSYKDNKVPPQQMGYMYKIYLPVHVNRSIETNALLIAGNGSVIYSFRARAHGADTYPPPAWPAFSNAVGRNEFSSDGNTPTGLMEIDLNTPEDNVLAFGPYPINRVVDGLAGNAQMLFPDIRNGILVHTGEWSNVTNWQPPMNMPNSLGCIHAWPESIYNIWQMLIGMGVQVRPNSDGVLPYPYKPQGLLSIELVDY